MIADTVDTHGQNSSGDKNWVMPSDDLSLTENTFEYIEQQEEATPTILITIIKCPNIAAQKHLPSHKQKIIKGLFKWTISFPGFIL